MQSSILACLGLVAVIASPAPGSQTRPNVLFIAVDDLRTNLGCYNDPVAITPHLDRLAARGTVFMRAYTQQAVCNPSRQSLLSGRRPDSIRVWDLHSHFRQTAPDVVSLPEHFKENGYFAQGIGKIYHGFEGMSDPGSWSVPEQYEFVAKVDDYRLSENRKPTRGMKQAATEFADADDDEYPDGKVAAAAIAALEGFARDKKQQPFFLAVGIRKPHLPFTAPKKYWDLYEGVAIPPPEPTSTPAGAPGIAGYNSQELLGYSDIPERDKFSPELVARLRRAYYASTSFADAQIGRVLDALKRNGFAENTIVVVWGDHGFHLGELDTWTKNTNYEIATRVPLIISAPGQRAAGKKASALIELLDLYPTLTALTGLPDGPKVEGRNISRLLDDPVQDDYCVAFSQFPRPWPGRQSPTTMGYTVRTHDYRYVEWRNVTDGKVVARELYAYVGDDLFERVNLADDLRKQDIVRKLAALLPKMPLSLRTAPSPSPARAKKK
jgi:iduronate 2-sulfatase